MNKTIMTLIRANLRHKKGGFISTIVFMLLITFAFAVVYSTNENMSQYIDSYLEKSEAADIMGIFSERNNAAHVEDKILENSHVSRVVKEECIGVDSVMVEDEEYKTGLYIRPYYTDSTKVKFFEGNQAKYMNGQPTPLGEDGIYLPYKMKKGYGIKVNDIFTIQYMKDGKVYGVDYVVRGFYADPYFGIEITMTEVAMVSPGGMNRLNRVIEAITADKSEEERGSHGISRCKMLFIYKSDDNITNKQLRKELSNHLDSILLSMTKEQIKGYFLMFSDIAGRIMYVLLVLLFAIMLIVIGHSVSTGIQMDYVNIGVLKSQGLTKRTIRMVYIWQYLLSGVVGSAVGMLLSPLGIKGLTFIYLEVVGSIADIQVSVAAIITCMLSMLCVMWCFVLIKTVKVGKISPIRAISGGQDEVYFSNWLSLPVSKRNISFSLAFRQITSSKKQYVSGIMIVMFMGFFMITTNTIYDMFSGEETTYKLMGMDSPNTIQVNYDKKIIKKRQEIEADIEAMTHIQEIAQRVTGYMFYDGEEINTTVMTNPALSDGKIKGKYPILNNEIMISEQVSSLLKKDVGDTITVRYKGTAQKYIVTGFWQTITDMGMSVCMTLDGMKRLDADYEINVYHYILENVDNVDQIKQMMMEKYEMEERSIQILSEMGNMDVIFTTVKQAVLAIYAVCVMFIAIAVALICSRTFIKERKDLGIYKSQGFTTSKLRLQFSLRFAIVSILGSICSVIISLFTVDPLLEILFGLLGIVQLDTQFTVWMLVLPVIVLCICFFLFSYISARKIKSVDTRSLIVE